MGTSESSHPHECTSFAAASEPQAANFVVPYGTRMSIHARQHRHVRRNKIGPNALRHDGVRVMRPPLPGLTICFSDNVCVCESEHVNLDAVPNEPA